MSLLGRLRASVDAFRLYDVPTSDWDAMVANYATLYAFWAGTWVEDPRIRSQSMTHAQRRLYKATQQDWNHTGAVVSLYEQFVYAGDLPSDPEQVESPDACAIPLELRAGPDAANAALRDAIMALWGPWNYQQQMSRRPKFGAILGDGLTELVDDVARGWVYPVWVPPWQVTDLELDPVGNIRRYTIEYDVDTPARSAYGEDTPAERYRFRKEVDKTAYRYYRDDRPDPAYGGGSGVEPNPYGFVPAIWDRHEERPASDRGVAAIQKTLEQALRINSVLSHAIDYQRKQFGAPVGVVDGGGLGRVDELLKRLKIQASNPEAAITAAIERAQESMIPIPMGPAGKFVTVSLDIGKTTEMLKLLMDSVFAEQPEAKYGQQLLEMSQATAPGVERVLAPLVGKVDRARALYDPQTVKKHQMTIAMIGWRLSLGTGNGRDGRYPTLVVDSRPDRYRPFVDFDLTSYGKGLLDFTIKKRPVFARTQEEKAQLMVIVESLQTEYGLRQADVSEDGIAEIMGARAAEEEAALRQITAVAEARSAGPSGPDNESGGTGPTGATGAAA